MVRPQPRSDFDAIARISRDPRSLDQIEEHYLLERRLSDRLRSDDPVERKAAYAKAYDELFSSLPHHPQHNSNFQGTEYIAGQSALLRQMIPEGAVMLDSPSTWRPIARGSSPSTSPTPCSTARPLQPTWSFL